MANSHGHFKCGAYARSQGEVDESYAEADAGVLGGRSSVMAMGLISSVSGGFSVQCQLRCPTAKSAKQHLGVCEVTLGQDCLSFYFGLN